MEFLVILVVMTLVVCVVVAPLRRPAATASEEDRQAAELETAREAKLREIRDAELDHRTGKLSDADFARVDADLRGEAIEILHALDRLR